MPPKQNQDSSQGRGQVGGEKRGEAGKTEEAAETARERGWGRRVPQRTPTASPPCSRALAVPSPSPFPRDGRPRPRARLAVRPRAGRAGSPGADWKLHQAVSFLPSGTLCAHFIGPRGAGLHAECVGNSVFPPWPERPDLSCSFIKSPATYHRHTSPLTACGRGSRALRRRRVLCLVFFSKIKLFPAPSRVSHGSLGLITADALPARNRRQRQVQLQRLRDGNYFPSRRQRAPL